MNTPTPVVSGTVTPAGWLCALWGVAGFAWILLDAIVRLSQLTARGLANGLLPAEWAGLASVVLFMAYMEGYRGFQRSFSPRTAARALYLLYHPGWVRGLLAPLFCMGFFAATRRPLLFAWVGTALIVLLVVTLRAIPQPWRAMVDAGVVVGLSWGLVSFGWQACHALVRREYPVSPAVPRRMVT